MLNKESKNYTLDSIDRFTSSLLPDMDYILDKTKNYEELRVALVLHTKNQLRMLNQIKNTLLAEMEEER